MSLGRDLEKFQGKTLEKMIKVKRQSCFDLFSSIVIATPVDKGVLRNNWFVANGTPSEAKTKTAGSSSLVFNKMVTELNRVTVSTDVFFTNNLPYAVPIEFDGHSAQAPAGMVRVNTARWDSIVKTNANALVNK